jgi:NAD-dependent deacetylase
MPFEMERIGAALESCTVFMAAGTSGVVEPAASFVRYARARGGKVRTYYVGPEEPANRAFFDAVFLGPSGELLPSLFEIHSQRIHPDQRGK